VILSTDDPEIAEIGISCKVEVPFLRPAELARDDTPMLPVVQHAVRWMKEQAQLFDAVCLLQPTNPLRRSEDIDACIDLFERQDADSVFTTLPVPLEHHPDWVYFETSSGSLHLVNGMSEPTPSRQQLPPAYHREGSVYVTRCNVLLEQNSLYGSRVFGYSMSGKPCVNIDDPSDWQRAEELITQCSA
jgi:CMP-N-acetylneuraminic acid synthetase